MLRHKLAIALAVALLAAPAAGCSSGAASAKAPASPDPLIRATVASTHSEEASITGYLVDYVSYPRPQERAILELLVLKDGTVLSLAPKARREFGRPQSAFGGKPAERVGPEPAAEKAEREQALRDRLDAIVFDMPQYKGAEALVFQYLLDVNTVDGKHERVLVEPDGTRSRLSRLLARFMAWETTATSVVPTVTPGQ